jgi:4-hydroxyphenylpyruvate dioxygenase
VLLYRQGGVNYIVNAEPDSFAQRFARLHGPSICAIAFRVQDAKAAYERAISLGAWGYAGTAGPGELNIPAIKGIGDSLIYLSYWLVWMQSSPASFPSVLLVMAQAPTFP